jgi:type II secretory pathway pseudopilin PulG
MFVFGALLGTNRRWWPWIFAPTGILLSLGPSEALLATISHYTAWTALGASVPYALIGLIASTWRPLAQAMERRSLARPIREPSSQRVRPSAVLNGLAAGALGVAILMHVFDPLGIQIATALPTFLGARNAVQDLRTKMNLEEALAAMDSYREDTGSFAGFDADHGSSFSPDLTWRTSGLSASELHPLEVDILSATPTGAALAAVSPSGNAFCVRENSNGSPTFGVATPKRHGSQKLTVSTAMGACGSTPWTPEELRPFPIESFCDGVVDDSILMCRAVQRSMRQTLATTS